MKAIGGLAALICAFSVLIWLAYCTTAIVVSIRFDMNCENYLKQAADANTIELAKDRLEQALIVANSKPDGSSHIIFKYPKNDVGFWKDNLNSCRT